MVLATLVAVEFVFIFYLETIATSSERTAKVFGIDVEELKRPALNVLFKNQGVYNLPSTKATVLAQRRASPSCSSSAPVVSMPT